MHGKPVMAPHEIATGNHFGNEPGSSKPSVSNRTGMSVRQRSRQRIPRPVSGWLEDILKSSILPMAAGSPGLAEWMAGVGG
jgi:hypothetical protein